MKIQMTRFIISSIRIIITLLIKNGVLKSGTPLRFMTFHNFNYNSMRIFIFHKANKWYLLHTCPGLSSSAFENSVFALSFCPIPSKAKPAR